MATPDEMLSEVSSSFQIGHPSQVHEREVSDAISPWFFGRVACEVQEVKILKVHEADSKTESSSGGLTKLLLHNTGVSNVSSNHDAASTQ